MDVLVGAEQWTTPALVVDRGRLEANLRRMLEIAGGPERLRPHCKTHKMSAVIRRWLKRGVLRHKCATLAEAHMLAEAGAEDILLAAPALGPLPDLLAELCGAYPQVTLSVLVDSRESLQQLEDAMTRHAQQVGVFLDLDPGLGRTGLPIGEEALVRYREICRSPSLRPRGLHWYDGQHKASDLNERRAAVLDGFARLRAFRKELEGAGLSVGAIVAGGTGSFPIYAQQDDAGLELSPGTPVLYDAGYAHQFPDLPFEPAAFVVTRLIARPGDRRLTWDAGTKAVAADPPTANRLVFPEIPDARIVLHNEEHIVVETEHAQDWKIGTVTRAIPWHICPTCNLYREAIVVEGGKIAGRWEVGGALRTIPA